MSLRDEVKILSGNKRKFFLLRVADMDTESARKLAGVKKGTYHTWLQNPDFVALYRRRSEFNAEYKQEAIQLLRRDNQLDAVLLEGQIVTKMKDELNSGEYAILKTNLAREVYGKLISDLDIVPQTPGLTWVDRIAVLMRTAEQIPQGDVIDGDFKAIGESETQSGQSPTLPQGEQACVEVEEKD